MTVGEEAASPAMIAGHSPEATTTDLFAPDARGWSSEGTQCEPKIFALASLANLEPPAPVASVSYISRGNVLVVAGADGEGARRAATRLASQLHVTLLAAQAAPLTSVAVWSGKLEGLTGFLGQFDATIAGLRTPQGPVAAAAAPARFDLVLDFSMPPTMAMREPPQGYFRAPADDAALDAVLAELAESVGEFEKPRYFAYRESICAHGRSGITGCNACVEICSTAAIAADGDHVKVDPHLCMGCGACATVCPSGAMSYQYPRVAERGAQLKQLLHAFRNAGGRDACVVFHDAQGRDLLERAVDAGHGLPERALPLEAWHVAAVGLDLLLPAIAFGASQVVILAAGRQDREYLAALRAQMAIGETILEGLGLGGKRFALIEADDAAALASAFAALAPVPAAIALPATFLLSNDKRTAIEFAVEHLARLAPRKVDEIALPAGSPFGEIRVDRAKCTMCMACVGACPESALMDGVDQPLLKFLERNCVQCGLCEATCPEDAIRLSPRLLLTPAVREARVVNETQPFQCVRCGKPFGTRQMVEAMLGRLAGHSMFTEGSALRRLQMCADCRVVDMMSTKDEVSVLKLGGEG
jgi:ferredoxin